MNQEERLDYLLEGLAAERTGIGLPENYEEKRHLLRGLMNVRPPDPIDEAWLQIQDEFLQREAKEKGIIQGDRISALHMDRRFAIWQGDITRLRVDAIVNAANSALLGCFCPNHSCIDNAIHSAAGIQLRGACHEQMEKQGHAEPTGKAKITPAFNLPSKYVIHTVGPIIEGVLTAQDCSLLAECYVSCMKLAAEYGCESIAFCCISTGEFHFPNEKAAEIAVRSVRELLNNYPSIKRVIFNVFKEQDRLIYERLLGEC